MNTKTYVTQTKRDEGIPQLMRMIQDRFEIPTFALHMEITETCTFWATDVSNWD